MTRIYFAWLNEQIDIFRQSRVAVSRNCPPSTSAFFFPPQKSPIITRQSSIRPLPSPFTLPPPSSSHFKNHQSSLANHQSVLCLPRSPCLRLLLPTSKITNHHSTIINPSFAFPVRPASAFFFHFKNHQSSLANHQSNRVGELVHASSVTVHH